MNQPVLIVAGGLLAYAAYRHMQTGQIQDVTTASGEGDAGAVSGVTDGLLNVGYQVMSTAGSGVSLAGLNAIKGREGFRASPYKDIAGLWTIGYGHKLTAGEWYDRIDDATATRLLASDISTAEGAVSSLVSVPLSQNQYDALVSFVYNVGAGAFRRSTMLRCLNSGDYQGAKGQFSAWSFATMGGVKKQVASLLERRKSEAAQFGGQA